ncbi:PDZ domain-containing protein GIPC3 [Anopheles aquasalis]|uniref:PDZ domain-containing protein GIPC3 n=1 Tax=Anopheles aquasalis TaxID=42839 RepID=UPI00215A444B|nr:PDZ domain-containing protein GIPC3 [Anopheles aquasalis]XP_050093072.1 PDZ domain-containing protein GIPC3 [Anopheles aquasalis]XP_050093073.1 PDZ domain-containing protein GIPC3 [Anopheles aquasalis]XP_050093074.1 PDZ domain-containing protein GIPC3 [Anopheles aquasalis]XP_050093075.1 PDZ domain-containing protein GIPC3 [Anopheles aquasalis]XP_050093076.1 PDZ domain-containing protein GIPC3 [Anopheles aquasalis]
MPLFNKKSTKISNPSPPMTKDPYHHDNNNYKNPPIPAAPVPHTIHDQHSMMSNGVGGHVGHDSVATTVTKPQLVFNCQLAHGSPTGFITGFASVKELYQKIAECYDFPMDEILFCTLNSHKVDMSNLLGGQIGLNDFIFAHKKGRPKEVEIVKSEDALGLTITDNGAGYAFIKRIKSGSVIDRIQHIQIGDHIEKLDGINVVGKRHYEVARMLKDIPTGSTFTIRLVEPMKSGFQGIAPRKGTAGGKPGKQGYGSGKETLRFKANGNAAIEDEHDDATQCGIDAINSLLDSFMGINDSELATQIWDLGSNKINSMDFAEAIDASDLEAFGFTDDFIIELWGAITDARQGRYKR